MYIVSEASRGGDIGPATVHHGHSDDSRGGRSLISRVFDLKSTEIITTAMIIDETIVTTIGNSYNNRIVNSQTNAHYMCMHSIFHALLRSKYA